MFNPSLQRTGSAAAAATSRRGSTILVRKKNLRMEEAIATTGLLNFHPATGAPPKQSAMYSGGMTESPVSEEYYHEEDASHTEEEDGFEDAQRDMYYHGTQVEETPQPQLPRLLSFQQQRPGVEITGQQHFSSSGNSTHLSSGSSTPHHNLQRSISFTNNNATPNVGASLYQPWIQASINNNNNPRVLANVTNMQPSTPSAPIPEWDGCNPDAVMKWLKSISK